MRFYQPHTEFYCGVHLHTRNMYFTVVNRQNQIVVQRNMKTDADKFLQRLEPYRSSVVVACESTSSWYWFADLCHDAGIEFVLGHALYMKAIHGSKKKNDQVDSEKIARLTAGGLLPSAYVYPRRLRCLRDLLRRRLKLTRQRAELYTHMHAVNFQFNLPSISAELKSKGKRHTLADRFEDPAARRSIEADLELIEHYTPLISSLETHVKLAADEVYAKERRILESIPGVGMITSLTMLLEIDRIDRFPTRQTFCSYSRLVYPRGESDGKLYATQGRKHGNPYLKWAFTEAAVHAASHCEPIKKLSLRLERK